MPEDPLIFAVATFVTDLLLARLGNLTLVLGIVVEMSAATLVASIQMQSRKVVASDVMRRPQCKVTGADRNPSRQAVAGGFSLASGVGSAGCSIERSTGPGQAKAEAEQISSHQPLSALHCQFPLMPFK